MTEYRIKKEFLDNFYIKFARWEKQDKEIIEDKFIKILNEISIISEDKHFSLEKTRFRQKADFYSLFLATGLFVSDGKTLKNKELGPLWKDFEILDNNIRPESSIEICSEYAIKCVFSGKFAVQS